MNKITQTKLTQIILSDYMYEISQSLLKDSLIRQQLLAHLKTKVEKDGSCGTSHTLFVLQVIDHMIGLINTNVHIPVYLGITFSFLQNWSNILKLRENKILEFERLLKTCDFYKALPALHKMVTSITKSLICLAKIEQDKIRVRLQESIEPMESFLTSSR